MDHPTLPENNDEPSSEPKVPAGLGWSELFHEFVEGTQGAESPFAERSAEWLKERTLYASENGDRWSLVRDQDTGRVFVRHTPNLASGGQTSEVNVGEFLASGGMGPEKQELRRLIGSIAERAEVDA